MDKSIDVITWVFIPLNNEGITSIRAWIYRLAPKKEIDEKIAEQCELTIAQTFEKNGLEYRTDTYGEIKMNQLRLLIHSDGICVPEKCFIDVPENFVRTSEPLQPFAKD